MVREPLTRNHAAYPWYGGGGVDPGRAGEENEHQEVLYPGAQKKVRDTVLSIMRRMATPFGLSNQGKADAFQAALEEAPRDPARPQSLATVPASNSPSEVERYKGILCKYAPALKSRLLAQAQNRPTTSMPTIPLRPRQPLPNVHLKIFSASRLRPITGIHLSELTQGANGVATGAIWVNQTDLRF